MARRRPPEVEVLGDLDDPPPKWLAARSEREAKVHVHTPFYRDPPADQAESDRRHRERNVYLPLDIGQRKALARWAGMTQEDRADEWARELAGGGHRGYGERWPHTVAAWCDDHDTTAWLCQQAGRNCIGRTHDRTD